MALRLQVFSSPLCVYCEVGSVHCKVCSVQCEVMSVQCVHCEVPVCSVISLRVTVKNPTHGRH